MIYNYTILILLCKAQLFHFLNEIFSLLQNGGLMTIAFCRIFYTIATQGSFIRAAELLHMTPSAVSHAVADAEAETGFRLFSRTKNGTFLTQYGEMLYPSVRKMLSCEEELRQSVDRLNGLEKGFVKIGIFNSSCTNWMPDIIKNFGERYPGIQLEIFEGSYEDVIGWIKTGIADFGFLSTSCTTELPIEPVYRDPLICLVPKDFITLNEGCITIDEMKDQQFVIQREGSDADVQMLIKKYNLKIMSNCHVIDDTSTIAMVSCGQGISVMPTLTAKGLEADLKVLRIVPDEARIIGLSATDKKSLSPAAKQLYGYIRDYVHALAEKEHRLP